MLFSVGERDGNGVEDGVVLELPRMLNYTKRKGGTNRGEGRVQRWMMQKHLKVAIFFFGSRQQIGHVTFSNFSWTKTPPNRTKAPGKQIGPMISLSSSSTSSSSLIYDDGCIDKTKRTAGGMLGEVYSSKAQDRHKENEKQTDYNYLHTSVSLSIGMAFARERDFFFFFHRAT